MPITTTPSGGPQGEFSTYTPLYSQTLSATTASITFSNIPTTYTDLVLVVQGTWAGTGFEAITLQFNGDTSSLYSRTLLSGNGTTASGSRESTSNWGILASATQSMSVFNIMNYSNTTTFKSVIARSGSSADETRLTMGLWRSTSAITSILVKMASNSIGSGTTLTLYGIKAAKAQFIPSKAAGGDIVVSDGTYAYHAFLSSGSFKPAQTLSCDVLVVAGGGGGGRSNSAREGGGGAGGLVYSASNSLVSSNNYAVTIGAGGPTNATIGNPSSQASSSSIIGGALSVTATGGGGGGYGDNQSDSSAGGAGGSGGGGGGRASKAGGAASPSGQGNAGGTSRSGDTAGTSAGGGGGGAGAAGSNGSDSNVGGNGGAGSSAYSAWGLATNTGQNVGGTYFYAGGGGGGGTTTGGNGGNGGGGKGNSVDPPSLSPGYSGTANTGGGGGGGFTGGSGIVIVRYAL